jgi:hypothetical protein
MHRHIEVTEKKPPIPQTEAAEKHQHKLQKTVPRDLGQEDCAESDRPLCGEYPNQRNTRTTKGRLHRHHKTTQTSPIDSDQTQRGEKKNQGYTTNLTEIHQRHVRNREEEEKCREMKT